jgi:hypothetical protein
VHNSTLIAKSILLAQFDQSPPVASTILFLNTILVSVYVEWEERSATGADMKTY